MDKTAFLNRLPGGAVRPESRPGGYPLVPPEDPVRTMMKNLAGAGAGVHRAAGVVGAVDAALGLIKNQGHIRLGASHLGRDLTHRLARLAADSGLELVQASDGDPAVKDLAEPLDAGLTRADLAVAEIGVLVQLAHVRGGRVMSLLPTRHIAFLHEMDILCSLPELAACLMDPGRFPDGPPVVASMIGGPSKTGDIEALIVKGVHGPGQLDVVIWR